MSARSVPSPSLPRSPASAPRSSAVCPSVRVRGQACKWTNSLSGSKENIVNSRIWWVAPAILSFSHSLADNEEGRAERPAPSGVRLTKCLYWGHCTCSCSKTRNAQHDQPALSPNLPTHTSLLSFEEQSGVHVGIRNILRSPRPPPPKLAFPFRSYSAPYPRYRDYGLYSLHPRLHSIRAFGCDSPPFEGNLLMWDYRVSQLALPTQMITRAVHSGASGTLGHAGRAHMTRRASGGGVRHQ